MDITITVNINSGINGALIYNAGSGDGKSFVLLPSDNSIIWPFGAAASTPNATITVPTAVEQNSTGNTASVLDAGVGAIYSWTITNGTITAGQSTRQITWTAGPVGQAVLGVSIMNGCFSSSGATVVIVNTMTNQTIAFDPIPEQTYGSGPITLNATASSGLPVTFSVVAGPATVSGNTLTLTGAGTVVVDANQAGNSYCNPAVAQQSFTVDPALLTVSGITASNKVYDSSPITMLNTNISTLAGVVAGDDVTLDLTYAAGNFADAVVGAGKTVQISGLDITGGSAGNYALIQPTSTADITPAGLTVSGAAANDKVYDGTTAAVVDMSNAALAGVVPGDDVTLNNAGATGSFSDKNAGTAKTVAVSGLALDGTDAGNYVLAPLSVTANISPAPLTVSAIAPNKVYDGTTTASATLTDNRVAGDSLSISYVAASFSNKAVGNGKPVTVSGIAVTGPDAANYTFNPTASTTANITAATVTGSVTANNKVYD